MTASDLIALLKQADGWEPVHIKFFTDETGEPYELNVTGISFELGSPIRILIKYED
jgi:hypothetical protein